MRRIRPMTRGRWLIAAAAVCLLLAAAGAAVAWHVAHERVADVHNGASLPFSLTQPLPEPTPTTNETPKTRSFGPDWPIYGRVEQRTRDASDLTSVKPPFHIVWKQAQHALLEFPPSYHRGILYLGRDDGWVRAINLRTANVRWEFRFGPVANQPAYWQGKVYFGTFSKPGSVYALDASSGHTIWRSQMTGQVESSMVIDAGKVFTGGLDGTVRALNALNGKTVWSFHAAGAVKNSLAIDGGRVFFGDYAGVMYCVRERDGHLLWKTSTNGLSGGFRSGTFYSSPAVAYGRVYIGNTDGKVYSFVAATGQVAWTSTMPDWAYGSPGVAFGKVYATSYDGTVESFDARTGNVIWRRKLPFRSLSSATIIGRLVYVADLGSPGSRGHMYALDPFSGRIRWKFSDGKYHGPIVAGGKLVIAGFRTLYVLRPLR